MGQKTEIETAPEAAVLDGIADLRAKLESVVKKTPFLQAALGGLQHAAENVRQHLEAMGNAPKE
jgi:hypothetical protein